MSIPLPPPFKIKMVEPIYLLSRRQRQRAIRRAGYNPFLLRSEDVYIDLLTDSGTNAMSQEQWSAMMLGDESYAGARSFYRMQQAVYAVYGFRELIPTHQGRAAEHILSKIFVKPGSFLLSNMYFTTSKAHAELLQGVWVDVSIAEAHDPQSLHPFKGNVDIAKAESEIQGYGKEQIAFFRVEANLNMAGGQPFSLENLRQVRELCTKNGLVLVIDGTRAVENAYFIQQREEGQRVRRVAEIIKDIFALCDVAYFSSKKDHLVNIGGFIATNNQEIARKARELVVIYEGLHTYGGLAGRDMEAIAQGMREAVDDRYIEHRVRQVRDFGAVLLAAGVPVVLPIGGHAVNLDARRFLPHLDQTLFPAQALTVAIYEECGVRSMERGIVSAGRDPTTGQNHEPELELVRLTIPRRVYTRDHLNFAAEGIIRVFENQDAIRGLKMTYEPENLRFFQARFERIDAFS